MTEITFTLPRPPSANNLFANVPKRGRVRTERYRTWLQAADAAMYQQRRSQPTEPPPPPYAITYEIAQTDNRRRDVSNMVKATEDWLVSRGYLTDDSAVDAMHVYRVRHAGFDGVRVTVRSLAQAREAAE